jgi:8-oxo-(d)GTP phosphatase
VVWRIGESGPEIVVIHRPRRIPDWSLPKGKLDRGEPPVAGAVREVWEETGLRVRLGPPLGRQTYRLDNGDIKVVDYWLARATGDDRLSTFVPNGEVDDVRWLPLEKARKRLTYPYDKEMLRNVERLTGSAPLLVVRHTEARNRRRWKGPDVARTLTKEGQHHADRLVPWLDAFGVRRVVSSNAVRCITTMQPYADRSGAKLSVDPRLSEELATKSGVRKVMTKLLGSSRRLAVCSHRPVLPWIFDALGIERRTLPTGGIVVIHRRDGEIVAVDDLTTRHAESRE